MRARPAFSSTPRKSAYTSSIPLRTFSVGVEAQQRELEVVEHGEQLLDETLVRPFDERGLVAQHALLVVRELGLHALQVADETVALGSQLLEIVGRGGGVGHHLAFDHLIVETARRDRRRERRRRRRHRRIVTRVCSPGSSTISASATSSSDGADDAAPSAPPAARAGVLLGLGGRVEALRELLARRR